MLPRHRVIGADGGLIGFGGGLPISRVAAAGRRAGPGRAAPRTGDLFG